MSWVTKRKKIDGTIQWIYRWNDEGKRRTKIIPNVKSRKAAIKIQNQWDLQRQILDESTLPQQRWTLSDSYQELMSQKICSPR